MTRSKAVRETSAGGVIFRRFADGPHFLLILDSHGNWGFPKGHVERGEQPLGAACREIGEETGIDDLILKGTLDVIDWYFRAPHALIHKYCHLFLFESPAADVCPQLEEGITACKWYPLDDAILTIAYDNSRSVLRKAGGLVQSMNREGAAVRDR